MFVATPEEHKPVAVASVWDGYPKHLLRAPHLRQVTETEVGCDIAGRARFVVLEKL
jgi:hypothetical protein